MYGGAISTTRRRFTIRPCNLSRAVTQPAVLRCALAPSAADQRCFPLVRRAISQMLCGRILGAGDASLTDLRRVTTALYDRLGAWRMGNFALKIRPPRGGRPQVAQPEFASRVTG